MATTYERESNEILSAVQIINGSENNDLKPQICRGIKRPLSPNDSIEYISFTVPETSSSRGENDHINVKTYLESNWEIDQPPVHEEVVIQATSDYFHEYPTPHGPGQQQSLVKQQQALLPRPLKDSLRKLKNLLKLPKARRWVYCEFFYSDVDRELLLAENEFRQCIRESFPNLKVTHLRRTEWRQVRRIIGRPRRCSQAFLDSERDALEASRNRIRDVQNGAALSLGDDDIDIPLKIPKPILVGTRIYARVREPKDGVYAGKVNSNIDGRCRIIFDKDILMPMVIPDHEIMSQAPGQLIPVSVLLEKNRVAQGMALKIPTAPPTPTSTPQTPAAFVAREDRCGNFPIRLVVMLVKLPKLIRIKKILVAQLHEMNNEAERMHLYSDSYVQKFRERYAQTVVELEKVNKQLEVYLNGMSEYVSALLPLLTELTVTSRPQVLHKFCQSHAAELVKTQNRGLHIDNPNSLQLVTSLTAFLLQIRALGQQQCNAFEMHSMQQTLDEIRSTLDASNLKIFEDHVEVHVKHLEFAMTGGDLNTGQSGFTN